MNSKVSVVATPTVVRVNVTTRAADASPEGTTVLSTGETGGTKYLREDGDGTSSWQTVAGAAGDMEASTYDPTTVAGDAFDMDNMAEGTTTKILTAAERTTIGTVAPHIADTANPHAVTKAQVGLTSVDDTADADKPVSTAQQTAIDAFAPEGTAVLSTGEAGAVKFLREDGDGTSSWQDVSGFAAIESSTSAVDLDFSTDSAGSKTLTGNTTFTFSNIIAGKTVYWHVTGASGYGINWPAEVTWIDSAPANPADGVTESYMFMAESASVVHGWHVQDVDAAVAGVTASTLGLGNVDNTSDTAKPVSTAQQTALDLKADLISPSLVTPALGTPSSGVATNLTGTAAGLTAGNVTTNANLTGHITSSGNSAVLGSFTSAQLNTAISDTIVPTSNPTGVTGADAVTNMMSLTQAEYDAITTPDAATLYIIPE